MIEAIALVTFSSLWIGAFVFLGFEAFAFGPGAV